MWPDAWLGHGNVWMGGEFPGYPRDPCRAPGGPKLSTSVLELLGHRLIEDQQRLIEGVFGLWLWLGGIELRCLIEQEVTLGWSPGR